MIWKMCATLPNRNINVKEKVKRQVGVNILAQCGASVIENEDEPNKDISCRRGAFEVAANDNAHTHTNDQPSPGTACLFSTFSPACEFVYR